MDLKYRRRPGAVEYARRTGFYIKKGTDETAAAYPSRARSQPCRKVQKLALFGAAPAPIKSKKPHACPASGPIRGVIGARVAGVLFKFPLSRSRVGPIRVAQAGAPCALSVRSTNR